MSDENYVYLDDGRIDYIEIPEGKYKFNYLEEDLDFIEGPEGKYEFFYNEEGELDYMETPSGTFDFYLTRTGKIDSIKTTDGNGEFVFYYDENNEMDIEAVGEVDESLIDLLFMFGLV